MGTKSRARDASDGPSVRLRADAWQIRAIERNIRPSVSAVAAVAGIPRSTMYRAVRGYPPSAETIAALLDALDMPFEKLFEVVNG